MFDDRMKTTAIPERVYALCKVLRAQPRSETELREMFQSNVLGNQTNYFVDVKKAANQLRLISIKEGQVSLLVDHKFVSTIEDMKTFIIRNISRIEDSLFYEITREYLNLGDKIFQYKSVTDNELIIHLAKKTGKQVLEDDLRAWRFWASFLGVGYLQEMVILPNLYNYLISVLEIVRLEKDREYTFREFITLIEPYSGFALDGIYNDNRLNLGISSALRSLHDSKKIKLKYSLDSGDVWYLQTQKTHEIVDRITSIKVGEIV